MQKQPSGSQLNTIQLTAKTRNHYRQLHLTDLHLTKNTDCKFMRVYSRTSLLNTVICTRSPSFITSLAHRFKNVSTYSVTKYKLKPQFIKSLAHRFKNTFAYIVTKYEVKPQFIKSLPHRFKNVSAYIVTKYEVKPQFIKSLPHRFKNVSAYIVTKYKVKPLLLHKYKTKGDRAFSHFGPSV